GLDRLSVRQGRVAVEVGFRIAERSTAQGQESIHVPALQYVLVGVEVDRKIEEVRYEGARLAALRRDAGLQHVEAFDDEDIGPVDLDPLVGHDVIGEMGIDRRAHRSASGLDVGEKAQQRRQVVALGKALLLHQILALENRVRIEKAIGGDEV